jgi:nitroreductase
MNPIIEQLRSHRSIRKYKDRLVEDRLLETILETAQCAATSSHVQAYTVVRVNNRQNRREIAELSGSQVWVAEAPVFLVFCADLNRLEKVCGMHGKEMTRGYAEQFIVATVDTALFAQNAMIAAESQGLGGVYIGGIRNNPEKVCELLHIPERVYPLFGMCLGYPDHHPPRKPRLPLKVVFKTDQYDQEPDEALLKEYDQVTNRYYKSRDSNQKDETWSSQMASLLSKVTRPHMKTFLQDRGFFVR